MFLGEKIEEERDWLELELDFIRIYSSSFSFSFLPKNLFLTLFFQTFPLYFCTFSSNNIFNLYEGAETDPRTGIFGLFWGFENVGMRLNGEIPVKKEEDEDGEEQKGREVITLRGGVGFHPPQKLVVGYALTSKKKKSFLQPKLLGLAR